MVGPRWQASASLIKSGNGLKFPTDIFVTRPRRGGIVFEPCEMKERRIFYVCDCQAQPFCLLRITNWNSKPAQRFSKRNTFWPPNGFKCVKFASQTSSSSPARVLFFCCRLLLSLILNQDRPKKSWQRSNNSVAFELGSFSWMAPRTERSEAERAYGIAMS